MTKTGHLLFNFARIPLSVLTFPKNLAPIRAETYWKTLGIGMSRSKVFTAVSTVAVSAALLFTSASSVSADPVHVPPGLEKFKVFEVESLDFADFSKDDIRGLLSDHFANNNGNHFGFINSLSRLVDGTNNSGNHFGFTDANQNNNGRRVGFSVASNNPGLKLGLSKPPNQPDTSVTENPEPTAILLLGSGLAGGAAFVRRRTRKRRQAQQQER